MWLCLRSVAGQDCRAFPWDGLCPLGLGSWGLLLPTLSFFLWSAASFPGYQHLLVHLPSVSGFRAVVLLSAAGLPAITVLAFLELCLVSNPSCSLLVL